MAFINEFKKRAHRRTVAYQVLMEDLVTLGVLNHEAYALLRDKGRPVGSGPAAPVLVTSAEPPVVETSGLLDEAPTGDPIDTEEYDPFK